MVLGSEALANRPTGWPAKAREFPRLAVQNSAEGHENVHSIGTLEGMRDRDAARFIAL